MKVPAQRVCYPKIGTFIDGARFQLVSLIGAGGYGKVYKAVDTTHLLRPSYAVKVLPRSSSYNRHQAHMREISLHEQVSDHPGVVTLWHVIEDNTFIYLVMDYAPDRDLFTQILHKRRFLGNDILIRSTYLQILDIVEHCHSSGVYHRDLKPENFVCYEGGLRVALADFGLATTQKKSGEFQTGSVYHMSPECQAAEIGGVYSPEMSDIWSLGIILLNIVTGRNPWSCAKWEDASFRSYRQNPYNQLPSVLPISPELNEILIAMLSMEWRARPSISEIRAAIHQVPTFYSQDVVFVGNVAKCAWEADRYRRPAVRDLDWENPCSFHGTDEKRAGDNTRRTKIFREKFPIFEEDSDSEPLPTICEYPLPHSDATSSTLGSSGPEKRLKSGSKSSFGSFFGGIQCFFRLCSSHGRRPELKVI